MIFATIDAAGLGRYLLELPWLEQRPAFWRDS